MHYFSEEKKSHILSWLSSGVTSSGSCEHFSSLSFISPSHRNAISITYPVCCARNGQYFQIHGDHEVEFTRPTKQNLNAVYFLSQLFTQKCVLPFRTETQKECSNLCISDLNVKGIRKLLFFISSKVSCCAGLEVFNMAFQRDLISSYNKVSL